MFFKNAIVFAFTRKFELDLYELEEKLLENKFTPCGSTEFQHFGFAPALGKGTKNLVHCGGGNLLVCARKETKILPAPVVKDFVDQKIEALETEQSRKATKKEKDQIKEDVIFEMLPRAFSRTEDIHGYINPEENIIVINTSSRNRAEDFLALLRKSLGTLPATSLSPEKAPDETMTEWLNEDCINEPFVIGMEATFNALGDDSANVKVKSQDLSGEEIKAHLDADKYVTEISLEWDKSISFILKDDLSIKRIKYFDVLAEQNDDIDSDDKFARLDADFILMSGELNRMICDVHKEFGVKAIDCLSD